MYKTLDQVSNSVKLLLLLKFFIICMLGLPAGGTFSNVMIDVGKCSGDCQGQCLPTKTRKETVRLYSGPREVEIIESCQCLSSGGSSCTAVKKEVTYFAGTPSETTIKVNQCVGSCRGMKIHIGCVNVYVFVQYKLKEFNFIVSPPNDS